MESTDRKEVDDINAIRQEVQKGFVTLRKNLATSEKDMTLNNLQLRIHDLFDILISLEQRIYDTEHRIENIGEV